MTCRELSELLCDHLEGELPWRRRVAFVLHLLLCGACRAYVASYRTTIRLARSCAEASVDGEQVESLVRTLLAAPPSTPLD